MTFSLYENLTLAWLAAWLSCSSQSGPPPCRICSRSQTRLMKAHSVQVTTKQPWKQSDAKFSLLEITMLSLDSWHSSTQCIRMAKTLGTVQSQILCAMYTHPPTYTVTHPQMYPPRHAPTHIHALSYIHPLTSTDIHTSPPPTHPRTPPPPTPILTDMHPPTNTPTHTKHRHAPIHRHAFPHTHAPTHIHPPTDMHPPTYTHRNTPTHIHPPTDMHHPHTDIHPHIPINMHPPTDMYPPTQSLGYSVFILHTTDHTQMVFLFRHFLWSNDWQWVRKRWSLRQVKREANEHGVTMWRNSNVRGEHVQRQRQQRADWAGEEASVDSTCRNTNRLVRQGLPPQWTDRRKKIDCERSLLVWQRPPEGSETDRQCLWKWEEPFIATINPPVCNDQVLGEGGGVWDTDTHTYRLTCSVRYHPQPGEGHQCVVTRWKGGGGET